MKKNGFFDQIGLVVFIATLISSFYLFYRDSRDIYYSLAAAILAAGLAWGTYVVIRWLVLSFR